MERQNFYKGQNVKADNLNELQDYTEGSQAELITSLLGYGVVSGFEVSIISGFLVRVNSGLAFSVEGNRLYLESATQVNLSAYTPNADTTKVKIGIVVDYTKSEPAIDSMGDTVYTKWTPTVQIVTGETLEIGVFELAEITLSPVDVTEIKTTSVSFTTLQQQIQNTSALMTEEDSATLQSQILKLLASEQMSLDSPLINLITSNFQINGTPYMEIGSNDNGTYVKFENGLLICTMYSQHTTTSTTCTSGLYITGEQTWLFPHAFNVKPTASLTPLTRSTISEVAGWMYTTTTTDSAKYCLARGSSNTGVDCFLFAIGTWK